MIFQKKHRHPDLSIRPKIAIGIAQCIALWSEIELQSGIVLAKMLKASAELGIAMYHSLTSTTAQFATLQAIAEAALRPADKKCFDEVQRVIKSIATERNKLSHWLWGYSDQIPDGLLLVEPKYRLKKIAAITVKEHKKEAIKAQDIALEYDKITVYRDTDFVNLARDMREANILLRDFGSLLGIDMPIVRDVKRAQLYSARLIQGNKSPSRADRKKSP